MKSIFLILALFAATAFSESITVKQLEEIMPGAPKDKLSVYVPDLNKAMAWGKITTCHRIAAFLGEIAEESGQLVYMEEIGSGAEYNGRCKDLGNCQPGDGEKYKGRGPIQITGKNNYRAAGKALGVNFVKHPTLAAEPQYAFKTAVWFWNTHGLSKYADENTQSAFNEITLKINGCVTCSTTHNNVRTAFWKKAKKVLGC